MQLRYMQLRFALAINAMFPAFFAEVVPAFRAGFLVSGQWTVPVD